MDKIKSVTFDSLKLDSGKTLAPVTLAYHTYGKLNSDKSNAVLIFHALTGDSQPAGRTAGGARGWWDPLIGPGRVFDTDKFFVICSTVMAQPGQPRSIPRQVSLMASSFPWLLSGTWLGHKRS